MEDLDQQSFTSPIDRSEHHRNGFVEECQVTEKPIQVRIVPRQNIKID